MIDIFSEGVSFEGGAGQPEMQQPYILPGSPAPSARRIHRAAKMALRAAIAEGRLCDPAMATVKLED